MRSKLRDYQVTGIERAQDLEYFAMYADMGLGKTVMAIELMEHWQRLGLRRFVVVCPNAVVGSWLDDLAKWQSPLRVVALPKTKREQAVASAWDVLLVNYEAMRTLWPQIVTMRPQGLVCDEAHALKHRGAKQAQACRKVAQATRILKGRRLILTGTPVTKSPLDLWSECDVLQPGPGRFTGKEHILGCGAFKSFEQTVAIVKPHPRLGHRVPLYTFPPERMKPILETMAPWTLVLRKSDVLTDLPSETSVTVHVDMEDEQLALYKALKSDAIAAIRTAKGQTVTQDGQVQAVLDRHGVSRFDPAQLMLDDGTTFVSTPMITSLRIRLQQVTSGHIRSDDGQLVRLPSCKLKLLREEMPLLCDASDGSKLVVFCRFKPDVQDILDLAGELGIGALRLDGETTKKGLSRSTVQQFQTDEAIRILVTNIAVAGQGLTLTAADTALFYSHSTIVEHIGQASARIHRLGQTRPVEYRTYVARNTVDEKITGTNTERFDFAKVTLDDLQAYIEAC